MRTKRRTMPKETYMKTAREVLAKVFSLRNAFDKYSLNSMTLQTFCKTLEEGIQQSFVSNTFMINFRSEN
jgi:hypothetical protein